MLSFSSLWMLRRCQLSSSFGLASLFGTVGEPIKPQQVAGTSVPCAAHYCWHLGAGSENFSVQHVKMFTQERSTWKSMRRQTLKQDRRTQLNINICAAAHSCWHLTMVLKRLQKTFAAHN